MLLRQSSGNVAADANLPGPKTGENIGLSRHLQSCGEASTANTLRKMLKQQARLLAAGVFGLDLVLVTAAFFVSYWLRATVLPQALPSAYPTGLYPLLAYLPLMPLALALWAGLLLGARSYRSHRTVPIAEEAMSVIQVCIAAGALFVLAIFAFRLDVALLSEDRISRSWIALFVLVATLLLVAEKLALRVVSRYVRHRGYNFRTVLLIGSNSTALEMANSILDHSDWGFRLLGHVRSPGEEDLLPESVPLLGTVEDVPRIVEENVVDDVLFALPRRDLGRLEDLFLMLHQQGIRTRFALNILPHSSAHFELEELDGTPLLSVSPTPTNVFLLAFKRALDVALAVGLLAIGLPIIFLVAIALKITSGGNVLYRQTRCGLNGRKFTLYKFRTMVEGAHERKAELEHLNEMDGPAFKVTADPRVTPLGRVLRKFSLDELPQLYNVLIGDMSLVGPRPPIPEEVAKYSRWQRRRLSMKPGLTCLWQISGRNNIDFDRWMELDLEYIDSWSPSLDLKILLKTIPAVLSGRGAS